MAHKKKSILKDNLHLIRVKAEEDNSKTREAWESKYIRIRREKKSWLWRKFYGVRDFFG